MTVVLVVSVRIRETTVFGALGPGKLYEGVTLLYLRLAGAAALILPMLGVFWLEDHANFGRPGLYLLAVAILFLVGGLGEILLLLRAGGLNPSSLPVHVGGILIVVAATAPLWSPAVVKPNGWIWLVIAVSVSFAIIATVEMWRYREPGSSVVNMSCSLFAMLYVTLPLCFLLQIRVEVPGRLALVGIVSVIFVVKWSDAGAYFAGRFLGRHQMAPVLSPKKTLEGAVVGILMAMIAAWVYFRVIATWWMEAPQEIGSMLSVLGYGLSLALAGIAGDLTESLVKRDVRQKDASSWIPGLGGILDVVDSLLWAAPLAYLWWFCGAFLPVAG